MASKLKWIWLLALLLAAPVKAASELSVSPPFQQVVLPGDQAAVSFDVEVANRSASQQTLNLSLVDFGALTDTGGVYFIGAPNDFERKYGLVSWMNLDHDNLTLAPGSSQKIRVTVDNRGDLTPGGHYGAVLGKLQTSDSPSGPQVTFKTVISSLVFLIKSGGERYDLRLDKLQPLSSWRGLPDSARLRFYNPGNVHVTPRGSVKLYDPLGREVGQGTINQDSSLVLPETARAMSVRLTAEERPRLFGRYQLVVRYRYDGYDGFRTAQTSFWLVNWAAAAAWLLAGAGLIAVGLALYRRRKTS